MKELMIEAKIENLDAVLEFVGSELETAECPVKTQTQISIAVEEVFVNIAHYAYHPETGGAVIRVAAGNEILIEFEDSGKPYNPLENKEPDITAGAEDRKIGGLGIFMVRKIMGSVEYRREGNKNILRLQAFLGGGGS